MKKIAVVGLGNILMGDDGAGVKVIEELERDRGLSKSVVTIRAETAGVFILPQLEGADTIILVDAVDFDGDYGEVRIFSNDDIITERPPPISMHEVGMKDLVSLLHLQSPIVPRLTLVGVKPKKISCGVELSSEVRAGVLRAAQAVLGEINKIHLREK